MGQDDHQGTWTNVLNRRGGERAGRPPDTAQGTAVARLQAGQYIGEVALPLKLGGQIAKLTS
ncbi:MAG: hypothetical protein MI725_04910, partial [Pirellulales bacterium]|nr:hypothetical protein [Pirellulales bacterium]